MGERGAAARLPRRPRDDPRPRGRRGAAPRAPTCHRDVTDTAHDRVAWRAMNGSGSSARSSCPTRRSSELVAWQAEHLPGIERAPVVRVVPRGKPARHARVPRLTAGRRRAGASPASSPRRAAGVRDGSSCGPADYRETRERRDDRLRRTWRARRRRLPRTSRSGSRGSACTGGRARPWLPHVTVLRFRQRPRLAPAGGRTWTFDQCRPVRLSTVRRCGPAGAHTTYSKRWP